MQKVIDQLFLKNERPISLIGHDEKEFEFMCWHYIDFAENMGFESYQATKELRAIKENQLMSQSDLKKLIKTNYFNLERLDKERRDMVTLKEKTNLPVGGGCFGPLTVVSSIIGVEKTLRLSVSNAEFLEEILTFVTGHMIQLAKEESKLGMHFFWVAEPLASLFAPKLFYQFCGKYLKSIFDAIDEPGYLHVCGKTIKHTQCMVDTGAQVLSIDYCTDLFDCIRMVPDDVVIMGNINPMLLRHGNKDEIADETIRINDACKNYKNFIFSTGCSIPEGTPLENIEIAVQMTKNYKIFSDEEYKVIRRIIKGILNGDSNLESYIETSDLNLVEIAFKEAELIKSIDRRYQYGKY